MKKLDDNDNVVMLMKQLEVENGYIFDAPQPDKDNSSDGNFEERETWNHNVNLKQMRDNHSVERPQVAKAINQNLEQLNRSQEPPQNRNQTKVQQLVLEDTDPKQRSKPA